MIDVGTCMPTGSDPKSVFQIQSKVQNYISAKSKTIQKDEKIAKQAQTLRESLFWSGLQKNH